MQSSEAYRVITIEMWPVEIPLTIPFVIATGRMDRVRNLIVRISLASGISGYGEIAPFFGVTEECLDTSLAAAQELAKALAGQSALRYRQLGRMWQEMAPGDPAARCGMETAVLDALCRMANVPLWALWGGADVRERETDITIPITSLSHTRELARSWYEQGFRLLKLKVGTDWEQDLHRVELLHRSFHNLRFVLDANQGFTRDDALRFAKAVEALGASILCLEQPLPREDIEGLAWLRRKIAIPLAADETVRTLNDAKAVIRQHAADLINLKITKSGVLETLAIATYAQQEGIRIMLGGMIETRVAMGASWSIALGLGGCDLLDLDTPLLLACDPVKGGYHYEGPHLQPWFGPGLALAIESPPNRIIVQA
ncbi:MAG: dipeptide epimerase [Nitrospirae bacterium]|nr:MAG: dipeptide epimerase [Nitrospirota bacterium]